ncbi:MAG: type II toxin-antitoxin system HicB family antitoxin [Chloroflexota bacterium]
MPRDLRFEELQKILLDCGYRLDHCKGSHAIFVKPGCNPLTIPAKTLVKSYLIKQVLAEIDECLESMLDKEVRLMLKDISYYMNLPDTRELIPEPEGGWFVRIKELPGCMSQSETPEEAMQMIEDVMHGWLEVELKRGSPIPEPRPEEEYSG